MYKELIYLLIIGSIFLMNPTNSYAQPANDLLIEAINKNDLDAVKTLIREQSANVNYASKDTPTPLIAAINKQNIPIVKYLLSKDANPNLPQTSGQTKIIPLNIAIEVNNIEIVKILVESGADVNSSNRMIYTGQAGDTPLIFAIKRQSSLPIAEYLIANGAKVNKATSTGYTPLMAVADFSVSGNGQSRYQIALLLLKNDADPNIRNSSGKNALHFAIDTDFYSLIKLLQPITKP